MGQLSGVEPDLLASAFELCREGTICAGAALSIARVPAVWSCPRCGTPVEEGKALRCALCGAAARLTRGGELLLSRIEMEVSDV